MEEVGENGLVGALIHRSANAHQPVEYLMQQGWHEPARTKRLDGIGSWLKFRVTGAAIRGKPGKGLFVQVNLSHRPSSIFRCAT